MPYKSPTLRKPTGFVLPVAIFLLVVLASLAAFMLHVSAGAYAEQALEMQSVRAYQAARLGIERGLMSVLQENSCPATQTINLTGSLNGFVVKWTCTSLSFSEGGVVRNQYSIVATASYPVSTAADAVERQLQVLTER